MSRFKVIEGENQDKPTSTRPKLGTPVPVERLRPINPDLENKFADRNQARAQAQADADKARTSHGRHAVQSSSSMKIPSRPKKQEVDNSQISLPLDEANTISVVSRKGGVGRTTIAAMLAAILAASREGPIVAVESDVDAGPLGFLLAGRSAPEFKISPAALQMRETLRAATIPSDSKVDVIAPSVSALPQEMSAFVRAARRHFDVTVFDAPAQVEEGISSVFASAGHVSIVVCAPNREGARAAKQAINWLVSRGQDEGHIIVAINGVPRFRGRDFVASIREHFANRVGAVVEIPLDTTIPDGAGEPISVDEMAFRTRKSFEQLAVEAVKILHEYDFNSLEIDAYDADNMSQLHILPEIGDHNTPTESVDLRDNQFVPTNTAAAAQLRTQGDN